MNSLLSFLILIGVLIFVHELGHFLTGKLLGVKVLAFSLGFPPRLLGKRIGETEYVLGMIPLGGYVKFLGEDNAGDVPPEEMARAFHMQPVWKRVVIVTAGPLMNLVFPFFIYFVVLSFQPTVSPPVVGMLVPGGAAQRAGLAPGDRIVEIDGKKVLGFDDLRDVVGDRAGKKVKVVFTRGGKTMERVVDVERGVELLPLDLKREVGRIGVYSSYRAPVIQVPDTGSAAWEAGLRTGDLVVKVGETPVRQWEDLAAYCPREAWGDNALAVTYLRPRDVPGAIGTFAVYDPGEAHVGANARSTLRAPGEPCGIGDVGIESTDLYVAEVTPGSPAAALGMLPGDRVVRLDGSPVPSWDQLEQTLRASPDDQHEIAFARPDGAVVSSRFKLSRRDTVDQLKQPKVSYVFGAFNNAVYGDQEPIPNPNRFSRAARGSVSESIAVVKFTFIGIVRIFQGKISSKTLGGPIMIFDIAGKAAKKGASSFLWLMALISINLGIINLVPIPLMDGGLLLLFLIEGITRRSPGQRFRLVYQYVGFAIIGLLIVFVFKNDIERYWDSITEFVKGG